MKKIALIAHDHKKEMMLSIVRDYAERLSRHHLLAIATTGKIIKESTKLQVATYLSGPQGGDQQGEAKIASQDMDVVLFLRDPHTAQPNEPDITALLLLRLCDVHNVPVATNEECARLLISALGQETIA